jgi:hypothetical protein
MDRIVAASTAPLLYCSNALYFCGAKIWWAHLDSNHDGEKNKGKKKG